MEFLTLGTPIFLSLMLVGVMVSIFLTMLLLSGIGKRIQQVSEVRYDYKVVDVVIMANPGNHEKQIQKWADEGWSLVACIPLTGGATEGAPEVRYVISRPWSPQRVARALRDEKRFGGTKMIEAEPDEGAVEEIS
jgi:hypothetical protein